MISVVMPTLNAQLHLPRSLPPLAQAAFAGLVREVIVSDGGSRDQTLEMADAAGCEIIQGASGRGAQMIRGANKARGAWLLFLHADTALESPWMDEARAFMQTHTHRAGYFRFGADRDDNGARRLAFWVRARCELFALPYGDQGLLISRALYDELGGFKPLPLMEDVDLVRRLGRARLVGLTSIARTSVAKHARDGYLLRSTRNLWLLAQFLAGVDPALLARRYD